MAAGTEDISWSVAALRAVGDLLGVPMGGGDGGDGDSLFWVVDGVGHSLPFEDPDRFCELVIDFVARVI